MNRNVATTLTDEQLTAEIISTVRDGGRLRRVLPDDGRVFLDRPLPFLCLYRRPKGAQDDAIEQLISTETSYFIVPAAGPAKKMAISVLSTLASRLATRFGGLLLIEFFETPAPDHSEHSEVAGEAIYRPPTFGIHAFSRFQPAESITAFRESLSKIRVLRQAAKVRPGVMPFERLASHRPVFPLSRCKELNIYCVGLEITSDFRDQETGEVFPGVLRRLRRGVERAVNQASFVFARAHTNIQPSHYYTLGRRTFVKAVWDADRRLAEVDRSFDMILQATPVNSESAWLQFKRSHFERPPKFLYRPLLTDPVELKRRLFAVPIERIEDSTIAHMLRSQQDAIDRKITMLRDIGTRNFRLGSCQVYGSVSVSLLEQANRILAEQPSKRQADDKSVGVTAKQFADIARVEIAEYTKADPEFRTNVVVCEDFFNGLMVSQGNLLIGYKMQIPASRVRALIAHEIGIHCLTWHNGNAQPLHLLANGLAGYDELQEGMAVLAEYFTDGLTMPRLCQLAARVIAVHAMLDGATFIETYRLLNREHGFPQKQTYTITMRVYRGGGLTKDAIYLRGLVAAIEYLREGGDFEPLWLGKISTDHVALVSELRHRGVLKPPRLRPHFLRQPDFAEKLQQLRRCHTTIELVSKK